MRFLQTGDWHLGKTLHEVSLYDDQKEFLNQVRMQLEKENYDALIVPGDIYDRPIPPAEAVSLLSDFLVGVHEALPELEIFLIAGNHDSAERLSFLTDILSKMKIHICTGVEHFTEPVLIEKGDEKVAVYQLPFLYAGSFYDDDGNSIKNQNDLYSHAVSKIKASHKKNYPDYKKILSAHLFTINSTVGASERSFIGTAEQVDASLFEDFDYTAVGHLHSFQPCGNKQNIYYSGAPLAYSFDEKNEKYMLDVEVEDSKQNGQSGVGGVTVKKIPILPIHRVVRLTGKFSDFYGSGANKDLISEHKNDFVEIVCTDEIVPEGAVSLLRMNFPNLLSFRRENNGLSESTAGMESRRKAIESNSPEQIFENFISEVYDDTKGELYEDEKKSFVETAKEIKWGE